MNKNPNNLFSLLLELENRRKELEHERIDEKYKPKELEQYKTNSWESIKSQDSEYIEGDKIVQDILTSVLNNKFKQNKVYPDIVTCDKLCEDPQNIIDDSDINFENDCYMWILQLKAFILDAMIDKNKKNSQTFLDFLDELNKISVVY